MLLSVNADKRNLEVWKACESQLACSGRLGRTVLAKVGRSSRLNTGGTTL